MLSHICSSNVPLFIYISYLGIVVKNKHVQLFGRIYWAGCADKLAAARLRLAEPGSKLSSPTAQYIRAHW